MLRLVPRLDAVPHQALVDAGIPLHLARILASRGVYTQEEASAFLEPSVGDLHDPMRLHDMSKAAERIHTALRQRETIVVYGDYDVDGVCAAAILVEALRAQGGQVEWYIPSRQREGYGLNADAVSSLSHTAQLLVTVDCGITSVEEAALAKSLGLDLIITDHHEPPEHLPDALAIVDPLLGSYPFRKLCGAGVALKLVWALFGIEALDSLWELAALATVADIVPLLGENRIIVHHGLQKLQHTRRPGLQALYDIAGLKGKTLTAGHLGFQIGPRINAGGRLDDASRNVELLLTDDPALATRIAAELNEQNVQRQRMEHDILEQANRWVLDGMDFLRDKAIIVTGFDWNPGVVGLAASRLMDRYAWPAIVLSENEEGIAVGSARSIPGVNLHMALTRCSDLFLRFGGHSQAAGMTLKAENIPELRERLNAAIEEIAEPDAFIPSAFYDLDIDLEEITIPLIEQFDRLAPTGFGNPSPVFRLTRSQILEARCVGAEGKHLKLRLSQDGAALDGIAFQQGAIRSELPEWVDVLFSPAINEYMGRRSPQCEVSRILPHEPADAFRRQCLERGDLFDCYLLEHSEPPAQENDPDVLRAYVRQMLSQRPQGTLLTVKTLEGAEAWVQWLQREGWADRVDYCFHTPSDIRRFNTLCALPDRQAIEGYPAVIALDDAQVRMAAQRWLPTDDQLRDLYRVLRGSQGQLLSEASLSRAAGLRIAAVRLGLRVFDDLGLINYRPMPFSVALLPPHKCNLDRSETLRTMRNAFGQEGVV